MHLYKLLHLYKDLAEPKSVTQAVVIELFLFVQ